MVEETLHSFSRPQSATGPAVHRVVLWNVRPDTTEEQIEAINVKGQELLTQILGVETFNQHPLHAQFGELYFNHLISDHYVVDYAIRA